MISVIITTYNRPNLLKCAVQSVLKQTFKDFELIIIDDCSSNRPVDFKNVRYIQHKENKGIAASRNTGIRQAKGQYIAFLDDDDEWLPEKLQKQIVLIESSKADVVYCDNIIVSENDRVIGKGKPEIKGNIRSEIIKKGLSTIPSSCLFKKRSLETINGFDENLKSHIDHDIWMKMAKNNYTADYVDEALVRTYQDNRSQMTTNFNTRLEATENYLKKWESEIKKWFGEKKGKKYCRNFYLRVLGKLGIEALRKGNFKEVFICGFKILKKYANYIYYSKSV